LESSNEVPNKVLNNKIALFITILKVDCIVNAAKQTLLGGAGGRAISSS